MSGFSSSEAAEFLSLIFQDVPGLINISTTKNLAGACYPTSAGGIGKAVAYAAHLEQARPEAVYFRITTLAKKPDEGKRGSAADTQSVPVLWADIDFGEEGHRPSGSGLPNPPTADDARGLIAEADLPEPSLLVHSGGGLYPLWRVEGWTDLEQAKAASAGVQARLQAAAKVHGWAYGAGVGDLARLLRLPGSVNRKTDNHRPCRVIA